ncbi:hypothetical protein [Arachidicoccus soli]|nr:hypothetical protein [Arachidicoccus soli]
MGKWRPPGNQPSCDGTDQLSEDYGGVLNRLTKLSRMVYGLTPN